MYPGALNNDVRVRKRYKFLNFEDSQAASHGRLFVLHLQTQN